MFSGRGQPSCEQLIDRYRIACRPVRDVLVDYLRERQPSVDFSSLQRFAYLLGKLFWADLQAHHPGIDSLKLPREVAAAWKQRVMTRTRATTSPAGEQVQADRAAAGRAQRAVGGACLLSRPRRVGRRRPGPVGTVGGALPGQRQRRVPQEGPVPAQVPHGPTHPGTAAGAASAGVLGRDRAGPHRRAARRRRTHPARCTVHHRGPGAAPHGDEDRDHRPRLGRAPRRRATPRPDLRRTPRLLDLGHGGGAAPHRCPDRGADRAGAPQPDPIPAAGHQRADPAAADRPVQDRRRTAAGHLTRARRRALRHRRPDPRRPDPRAAGGLLRQERTRLQPAHAAAVPMAPATGEPPGRRDRRCAATSTTR